MAKHYIRLNDKQDIIYGFSDDFEQPLETDICVNSDSGRHFELLGEINPILFIEGVYLYNFNNGSVIKKSDGVINTEKESIEKPKTEIEILKETVETLKSQLAEFINEATQ